MFFLNFLPGILSDDEVGFLEPVLADRVHLVPVLLILGNDFNTCIYTQHGVAKLALCDVIEVIGLRDTCYFKGTLARRMEVTNFAWFNLMPCHVHIHTPGPILLESSTLSGPPRLHSF